MTALRILLERQQKTLETMSDDADYFDREAIETRLHFYREALTALERI